MDFEKRYDQIQDYIKGKLSDAEKVDFEKEMAKNKDLADEVSLQKATLTLFEYDYLSDMSRIIAEEIKPKGIGTYRNIIIGSVIFFIAIGLGLYVSLDDKSTESFPSVNEDQTSVSNVNVKIGRDELVPIVKKREIVNDDLAVSYIRADSVKTMVVQDKIAPPVLDSLKAVSNDSLIVENANVEEDTIIEEVQSQPLLVCDTKPILKVVLTRSDKGESNGVIELINRTDRDLRYSINNEPFDEVSLFQFLEPGNYTIKAMEFDSCVYSIGSYNVTEDPCLKKQDYLFNRNLESSLTLELPYDGVSSLQIFNKMGEVMLQLSEIEEDEFDWDGNYDNGNAAEKGLHVVYLKSNEGKTCKYNVVVSK